MKVYIIYCTGGYNEQEVDRIFDSREKALDYIIREKFSLNFYYRDRSIDFLRERAECLISEFDVE